MALVYKCPSCGGDMVFDSDKQMLCCHSCGESLFPEKAAAEMKTEQAEVNLHKCPNCGCRNCYGGGNCRNFLRLLRCSGDYS